MMGRGRLFAALFSAFAVFSAPGAEAQDYPTRAIKFIVPFAGGSATDAVARIVGDKVSATLKQPVIIENLPGGSGVIAAQRVARAEPDGYTILITTNTTHGANQSLLAKVPYDAVADFEPIAKLATNPLILVINPSLPFTSVRELIDYARANPGKLTFGSGSSSSRVTGELLKARAHIDITHVPYRSIPFAVTDVIGGQISMAFADPQTGVPQINSGRVKGLAVSGTTRVKLAPDLPTMEEAGVPNYDIVAFFAAFAPAKTPKPVIDVLHKAMAEAVNDPGTAERLVASGIDPSLSSPEELKGFVVAEIKKWAEIVQAAGIKPE